MAPSPAVQQVLSPLTSTSRPPMPAPLMKTVPQQLMQSLSSPSHPYHHMGGSPGLTAPSPVIQQVSRPLPSKARPSTPACWMKTAFQHHLLQSLSSPSPLILNKGGASLAQHQATVLQCWKRSIWLCPWFNQQALLKQKRLHLQTLCRGASIYARLVRVNLRSPLTPTNKTSDPKALHHPFRTHGQPLPPQKSVQQHN
jgi:hypothetical protein